MTPDSLTILLDERHALTTRLAELEVEISEAIANLPSRCTCYTIHEDTDGTCPLNRSTPRYPSITHNTTDP